MHAPSSGRSSQRGHPGVSSSLEQESPETGMSGDLNQAEGEGTGLCAVLASSTHCLDCANFIVVCTGWYAAGNCLRQTNCFAPCNEA